MEEELYFHPVTGKLDIRPSTEPCTYNRRSSCDVVRNKRIGSKAFTSCLLIPENCDRMLVSNRPSTSSTQRYCLLYEKIPTYIGFFSLQSILLLPGAITILFVSQTLLGSRPVTDSEGRIKKFNQFNQAPTAANFFKVTRQGPYAERWDRTAFKDSPHMPF